MAGLLQAWQDSTVDLKYMDEGSRNHLIAMKDFYKRMILDRTIDDYLATRRRVADMHKKPEKMTTIP
jgi:hypothetical protein